MPVVKPLGSARSLDQNIVNSPKLYLLEISYQKALLRCFYIAASLNA